MPSLLPGSSQLLCAPQACLHHHLVTIVALSATATKHHSQLSQTLPQLSYKLRALFLIALTSSMHRRPWSPIHTCDHCVARRSTPRGRLVD